MRFIRFLLCPLILTTFAVISVTPTAHMTLMINGVLILKRFRHSSAISITNASKSEHIAQIFIPPSRAVRDNVMPIVKDESISAITENAPLSAPGSSVTYAMSARISEKTINEIKNAPKLARIAKESVFCCL